MEKDINIHNMYVVRLSKIFIKIMYLLLFIGYSHEQNSTYSVFMHVCEAWQPLLSLQIYSNNQLQMV